MVCKKDDGENAKSRVNPSFVSAPTSTEYIAFVAAMILFCTWYLKFSFQSSQIPSHLTTSLGCKTIPLGSVTVVAKALDRRLDNLTY